MLSKNILDGECGAGGSRKVQLTQERCPPLLPPSQFLQFSVTVEKELLIVLYGFVLLTPIRNYYRIVQQLLPLPEIVWWVSSVKCIYKKDFICIKKCEFWCNVLYRKWYRLCVVYFSILDSILYQLTFQVLIFLSNFSSFQKLNIVYSFYKKTFLFVCYLS